VFVYFVSYHVLCSVDDLIKSVRLAVITDYTSADTYRLRPPIDITTIPARYFAEQLTFIDAVSHCIPLSASMCI